MTARLKMRFARRYIIKIAGRKVRKGRSLNAQPMLGVAPLSCRMLPLKTEDM